MPLGIVNTVVSVKDGHEARNLRPVTDVVRGVAGFALAVYDAVYTRIDQAEGTEHHIVDTGNAFARDYNGNLRQQHIVVDKCRTVAYLDEDIAVEHRAE